MRNTITISVAGEASITGNKVLVDYTELKELSASFSQLQAERDRYKELLIDLMADIGGLEKLCGHEFNCRCAWDNASNYIKESAQQEVRE